jgi:hypothetical protein
MARSHKKNPHFANTYDDTEKDDKRFANRKLRRAVKVKLAKVTLEEEEENLVLPEMREVSDIWLFDKDGKRYWQPSKASPDYDYDIGVQQTLLRK